MGTQFDRNREVELDPLDRAIAAWKSESRPVERLDADARSRILRGAYEISRQPRLAVPGFGLVPRRWIATAVPVVLALVMVAFFPERTGDGAKPRTNVRVGRAGDEVVFTIANGSRGHTVYKSSDLSDFRNAERISVSDGTFRDQIHDDAGLVFYRID